MDPEQLEQVIDDLYALTPEEFVPQRSELAKAAKAAGDKASAATITALRRPTVGAWLVNTLVRHQGEQLEALFDLAASLRAAQDELDGDQLRQLTTQRGQLVAAMARQARALAHELGRTVSSSVVEEVEQTLRAALADPAAADEVRAGRLTSGLTYAGLGGSGGLGAGEGAVRIGASGAPRLVRPPAPATARPAPGRPPAAASRAALRVVPGEGGDVVALVTRPQREREAEREAARQAWERERERERAAARAAWQRALDDEARLRRGHDATHAAARAAAARAEQAERRLQQVEAELVAARQERQDAAAAAQQQQQDVAAATEALRQAGEAVTAAAERMRAVEAAVLDGPESDGARP